jgi:hypothetical protein
MFRKFLVINFCATIFWGFLGLTIWALSFVINLPEAQFWALLCLINFAPFFLGLSLIAGIGGAISWSTADLKELCRFFPCTGKCLPEEINLLINGSVYSICGICLYAMGMGKVLNDIGRYVMFYETNIDPLSLALSILGSGMLIIGLQLLRFFFDEVSEQANNA